MFMQKEAELLEIPPITQESGRAYHWLYKVLILVLMSQIFEFLKLWN